MNMAPKKRSLVQRLAISLVLGGILVWKFLRLPRSILPRAIRSVVNNWTYEMFSVVIKSLVTEACIDQTCVYKQPGSYAPRANASPEYQLSEQQIRAFHEHGFLGPFDAFSEEEMKEFREYLVTIRDRRSETYGFVTPRDRHLESPAMMKLLRHPAIVDRAAQLLGPDLLCWRSQIFYRDAAAPRIQWHQASTFMVEDYLDPALFPADRDALFQLTIWIAVDPATEENGCLEFIPGTHDRIRTIRFGGDEGYYKANFTLDFDSDSLEAVKLPARAGQFLMFSERCIHGSGPNHSTQDRFAFNVRLIPTSVAVYPNKKYYRSVYNGGKYRLDKWGVVLVRGEDHYQLSRAIDVERPLPPQTAPARRRAA